MDPDTMTSVAAPATESAPGLGASYDVQPGIMTAAQLMAKHHQTPHTVTAEEVPDEADITPTDAVSGVDVTNDQAAKSVGKKSGKSDVLDISDADAFPSLGTPAAKPVVAPTWGNKTVDLAAHLNGHSVNGQSSAPTFKLTGQLKQEHTNVLELQPSDQIPRSQLKKAPADIAKDIANRTGTKIQMSPTAAKVMVIIIKGQPASIQQARRELRNQLCPRRSITVKIPTSVRPYIIGKGGEAIKKLQAETGTKITVPKLVEGEQPVFEDDGTTVDITVEGDAEAAETAKARIEKIATEKTAHTTIRLTDIPGQYYPFIAGAHFKNIDSLQEGKDISISVPEYYYTTTKEFSPPSGPIIIKGEKVAANEAKLHIEKLVQEFREGFTTVPVSVNKSTHRFIYGDRGRGIHEILEASGCSVVLPAPELIVNSCIVVGPTTLIGGGVNKALEVARSYHIHPVAINKAHLNSPIGADAHARAIARLLKKTQALKDIEAATNSQIHHPEVLTPDSQVTFEIVARSQSDLQAARQQFKTLVEGYTAERIHRMKLDPLCHPTIIGKDQRGIKQIRDRYGIHVLVGENKSYGDEVFLVHEPKAATSTPTEEIAQKLTEVRELLENQEKELGDISEENLFIDNKFSDVVQDGTVFKALSQGNVNVESHHVPSKGDESSKVAIKIRGPSADVKATAKKISTWVESSKDEEEVGKQHVLTFEYPSQFSAMLIGSKGANVNKLRDELGVDIKLKEGRGEIRGFKVNAEVARRRLFEQIKQMEDNTTIKIKAPQEHHRTIIGSQGKFVRRLEEKYGVRITFPKSRDDDAKSDNGSENGTQHNRQHLAADEVMVKGGKKGVAEAKKEIEDLLQYEIENNQTAHLTIPVKNLKALFSSNGREFKRIREESGARIEIGNEADLPPDAKVDVKIRGTKEAVATAKKDLMKLFNEIDQLTIQKIQVDKKYHRALIGAGGATLREIVEKAGGPKERSAQARMVHFPNADSPDDVITVTGNQAIVDKIVESINKIVAEKQSQLLVVVDISPDKHWKLIGRGGSIRQELEATFKVNIDVPRQNPNGPSQSGVTITGAPADVEAAKAHITSLTQEAPGETVMVPRHLHHAVADGGLFIKKLRNDFRVNVEHNGETIPPKPMPATRHPTSTANDSLPLITDENQDEARAFSWVVVDEEPSREDATTEFPWVLKGFNADAIAGAKELLLKQIATVKAQTSVGYLTLPDPSKHRLVVGPGGSRVSKIKDDTGCRIMVPKDRNDGEAIVMHGTREGLEEAKNKILEIVGSENSSRSGREDKDSKRE